MIETVFFSSKDNSFKYYFKNQIYRYNQIVLFIYYSEVISEKGVYIL